MGLGDRSHHYPAQLSGGEQQRVAARARLRQPADASSSPTSPRATSTPATGGAWSTSSASSTARRGTTLVLVTHEPDLAARARRVIRLGDGALVEDTAAVAAGARA